MVLKLIEKITGKGNKENEEEEGKKLGKESFKSDF